MAAQARWLPYVKTSVGAYGVLALVDTYCAFQAIWDQSRTDQHAAILRRDAW